MTMKPFLTFCLALSVHLLLAQTVSFQPSPDASAPFPGVESGSVAFSDGDGGEDLLITGSETAKLYRNDLHGLDHPGLTGGLPKGQFGVGAQTDEVTLATYWRWSEKFYGFINLADIRWMEDPCGDSHVYTVGEATGAIVEYQMEFGGAFSQLVLRGIADAPAPVEIEVFIDGQLKTKTAFEKGSGCNQLAFVKIPDIPFGTHAIGLRFANDFWDPDQGIDRNFYLDALMVIETGEEGIPIYVGEQIQSWVSPNPTGTTFILKATDRQGNNKAHRRQPIIPRDGDRFIGQEGATLSGAMELTNWRQEGEYWVHDGPDELHNEVYHENRCEGDLPCHYPEDLFMDDRFCRQVNNKSDLTAFSESRDPTWYWERDDPNDDRLWDGQGNRKIYIKGDPTGHKWEISVTGYAFSGLRIVPPEWPPQIGQAPTAFPTTDPATIPDNITIRNLIIEKFANPGQFGAIGFQDPGEGWIIEDNEVRWNHAAGILAGSHALVKNNYVHDNGQIGIKASRNIAPVIVEDVLIEGNRIIQNGKAEIGFQWLWEAGGTKFTKTDRLIVRNNTVQKNRGPGLWTDIDNVQSIIEYNLVEDNLDNGIFHEISYDAVIRHNTVRRNGGLKNGAGRGRAICPYGDLYHHAQIQVSTSENVEVYNNWVETGPDMNGIIVRYDYRDEKGTGNLYKSNNVSVHHNQILVPADNPYGISGGWINTCNYSSSWQPVSLSESGHRFDYDQYRLGNLEGNYWIWENGDGPNERLDLPGFQVVNQELNGGSTNSFAGSEAIYFNDGSAGFTTTLVHPVIRTEASQIDFNWPDGSPDVKIGSRIGGEENNFSARFRGSLNPLLTAGENSASSMFRVTSDDGFRIWIQSPKEVLVYEEKWDENAPQGGTTSFGPVSLSRGNSYFFRLEYFHRGPASEKDALLKWEWKKGDGAWQVIPAEALGPPKDMPVYGLQGSYYDSPQDVQTGNIKLVRQDQQINFNWDRYVPDPAINDDGDFAVIWKGKVRPLYDGDYYFFTRFNSEFESMTFWIDQPFTRESTQRYRVNGLKAGEMYDLKIEYSKTSDAKPSIDVMLEWESLNGKQYFQLVPSYCLYPPDFPDVPQQTPPTSTEKGLLAKYHNMNSKFINSSYWKDWPGPNAYPSPLHLFFLLWGDVEGNEYVESPVIDKVSNINFNWRASSPDYRIGADYFTTQFVGYISLPEGEEAGIREFQWKTDDGGILEIGIETVVDTWTDPNGTTSGQIFMEPRYSYHFEAKHFERGGAASANAVLKWRKIPTVRDIEAEAFEVVPPSAFGFPSANQPLIEAFILVQDGIPIQRLAQGSELLEEDLDGVLDILALPYPEQVAKVEFELDGELIRTSQTAPYLLIGESVAPNNWPPDIGSHVLKATPYTSTGEAGMPLSLNFQVIVTSIEEALDDSGWTIFPNPTSGWVQIRLADPLATKTETLILFNSMGQEVLNYPPLGERVIELDLSPLPTGIYLIQLQAAGSKRTKRLVVH